MHKYQKTGKLGEGVSGTVWKASNKETGRSVALKIMSKDKVDEKAFNQEVQILSTIKPVCKNYLLCYEESFTYGNNYVLVTEDLSGYKELFDVVLAKPYSKHRDYYRTIMSNIIKAVLVLSNNMISHRDIKPENIMVDAEGNVKFIDYGGSCVDKNCYSLHNYTFAYAPPEYFNWSEPHKITKIEGRRFTLEGIDRTFGINDIDAPGRSFVGDTVRYRVFSTDYDHRKADIWALGNTLWMIVNNNIRPNLSYVKVLDEDNIDYYLTNYPFLPEIKDSDKKMEKALKRTYLLDMETLKEVNSLRPILEEGVRPTNGLVDIEVPKGRVYYLEPNLEDMFKMDPKERKIGVVKEIDDTS